MVKKKDNEVTQLSLFSNQVEKDTQKKPRPKNIPATKNTDASASGFGWRFQVMAGIVLSIHNIKELKSVEIEGSTEDVELKFNDKDPEYIQVKAVQGNPIDTKDNTKAALAMNTLINTSNITNGEYSKLVYVVNFMNPLDLDGSLLNAFWLPRMDAPFIRPYNSLPRNAKQFVQGRIKLARKQLAKGKYLDTVDHFDLNRLYVVTILVSSNDQDEQNYSVLEGVLDNFFSELKLSLKRAKINNVKNMLVNRYLANAGSKESKKNHEEITKEILVWRMIFEIIDEVPNTFYDDIPAELPDELDLYENDFIKQQVEDIDVINKVLAGINRYVKGTTPKNREVKEFVENKWMEYRETFPLGDDPLVQEYGIKMIMLRILNGERIIERIKKGVNL
ncbi:hypothetical protein [Lactiplantibacillus plantarum]|uniref:hypothetical protein n=1 Tax=Lactiplantibacillus plantarum TaxID=1590 RepID=UPI002868CF4E|nr:hypothetical protein [Lactiplantibacillus plantarum]WMX73200.1 hypothetical protein RF670_14330 [Lactiplantibacillus plantarum]